MTKLSGNDSGIDEYDVSKTVVKPPLNSARNHSTSNKTTPKNAANFFGGVSSIKTITFPTTNMQPYRRLNSRYSESLADQNEDEESEDYDGQVDNAYYDTGTEDADDDLDDAVILVGSEEKEENRQSDSCYINEAEIPAPMDNDIDDSVNIGGLEQESNSM